MTRPLFAAATFSVILAFPALATEPWRAALVSAPGAVSEVRGVESGRVFARTPTGWVELRRSGRGVCSVRRAPPTRRGMPRGGLADGEVASAPELGIAAAWLAKPTTRYAHAVIGDGVEAGALVVVGTSSRRYRFDLPRNEVFEDRFPRIADLDGDGKGEVVVIQSNRRGGGSIAIYGLVGQALKLKFRTPPIGRSYRWLNPVGIADFDGDGRRMSPWSKRPILVVSCRSGHSPAISRNSSRQRAASPTIGSARAFCGRPGSPISMGTERRNCSCPPPRAGRCGSFDMTVGSGRWRPSACRAPSIRLSRSIAGTASGLSRSWPTGGDG